MQSVSSLSRISLLQTGISLALPTQSIALQQHKPVSLPRSWLGSPWSWMPFCIITTWGFSHICPKVCFLQNKNICQTFREYGPHWPIGSTSVQGQLRFTQKMAVQLCVCVAIVANVYVSGGMLAGRLQQRCQWSLLEPAPGRIPSSCYWRSPRHHVVDMECSNWSIEWWAESAES